ncbi:MAG: hypothetical protein GXP08_03255 [Gammaproteobacteria bacterium]|nr:hypothetical protein [Gammaproteobacteria bacterium]
MDGGSLEDETISGVIRPTYFFTDPKVYTENWPLWDNGISAIMSAIENMVASN